MGGCSIQQQNGSNMQGLILGIRNIWGKRAVAISWRRRIQTKNSVPIERRCHEPGVGAQQPNVAYNHTIPL